MAFVGEAVLTVWLEALFEKLTSSDLLQFARQEQILADINKWENILKKIHAVLDDAEEKQLTSRPVKMWLEDLRDLAYDVDDILDDFATEALGRKLTAETQPSSSSKVRRLIIPSCCTSFSPSALKFNAKMRSKIDAITSRLQDISAQKNDLCLTNNIPGMRSNMRREVIPTTCLVDESLVWGREADEAALVDLLLQAHGPGGNAVGAIPIIGMGGLGKTTLAQLAYNNDKVKNRFDLRVWVCVSDDFDVVKVTETILQKVASRKPHVSDLDQLQVKLKEELSGKKFLLVLDDVWNENCEKWDNFYKPIRSGEPGSKVIVTTRNEGVVSTIGARSAYVLKELSNDDCFSLFAQQALGTTNFDAHPHLTDVGHQIVNKCKGLPLAAKTLAGTVRGKLNLNAWEDILKSNIWDLPEDKNDVLLALKLSYHYLPSHLKRCLAYCSIFPKDYEFNVDELVLLWMGEGFLHQVKSNKHLEEIGVNYFNELLARSFFQYSNFNSTQFVMHDLVNDLAKFVVGDVCFNLEENLEYHQQHVISERTRHSSFIHQEFEIIRKFRAFDKVKNVRTLLALPLGKWSSSYISMKVLHNLLIGMKFLRVISLTGYEISEMPNVIGELKYLRYVNLSYCSIKRLPNSMGSLHNLQTLILAHCNKLNGLPKDIGKLISLRHLDIVGTIELREIPSQIGNLTNWQKLSKFIVSRSGGLGIEGLKNLLNLQGKLLISGLQDVVNTKDAIVANLNDKRKIEELAMEWSDDLWDSRNEVDELHVLESLQPYKSLERLSIDLYGGSKFPSWVGDPSFSKMSRLTLKNCKRCSLLPSLGDLSLLEVLWIGGMREVKSVGAEFYGEYCSNPFPSLKELRFEDMPEWESWSHSSGGAFPSIEKLTMKKCPKLSRVPKCLKSLGKLELSGCAELSLGECDQLHLTSLTALKLKSISRMTRLRSRFSRSLIALQELRIYNCSGLTCVFEEQGLPCNLKILRIRYCDNLERLPDEFHTLACLEELEIEGCPKLESFPDTGFPPVLKRLSERICEGLKMFPHNYISQALEYLMIYRCPSLRCFPCSDLPTKLKSLCIEDCVSIESLPEEIMEHNSTSCLEVLDIYACGSLKSFPRGVLPSTLKMLQVDGCSSLESISDDMCRNSTTLDHLFLSCYPNLKKFPKCFHGLKELCVSGCEGLECFPATGLSTPTLTLLNISRCASLRSLPHQMRNLQSLRHLIIKKCPRVESLPDGGFAPNLTSLTIDGCENLKMPISEWGLHTLSSLSELCIEDMFPNMVSLSAEDCLLPMSVTSLTIGGMEPLASMALRSLYSLRILRILDCQNLRSLTLPLATLGRLEIRRCPATKERCSKDKGDYWPKIAHIPCILLDGVLIN